MNRNDPIRMEDFTARNAPGAFTPGQVSRAEAGRQFRFSLALVVTLAMATAAVATTMPTVDGRNHGPQVAQNSDARGLTYTVTR